MNPSPQLPAGNLPTDPDLAEQAVPGHGVPSQDPDAAAQVTLSPEEAERESKSVLMGGGVMAGSVSGGAIGAAVAGPVGIVVGGILGGVAGGIGLGVAGELAKPNSDVPADDAPAQSPDRPRRTSAR